MKSNHTYVFLSSSLLRFYQTGGSIDADNQAAGDLGIEGTTVASLFDSVFLESLALDQRRGFMSKGDPIIT